MSLLLLLQALLARSQPQRLGRSGSAPQAPVGLQGDGVAGPGAVCP